MRYVFGRRPRPENRRAETAAGERQSRVDWIGGTGFGFEIESEADAELARRVMEFDALNQSQPDAAMRTGLRASVA